MTTYFASPTGIAGASGRNRDMPFTPKRFFEVAQPGDVLNLMDGTYMGDDYMLAPQHQGLKDGTPSGTEANPITIRALNDGAVLIDGQSECPTVEVGGCAWLIFEGFNARLSKGGVLHVRSRDNPSSNLTFRRIVAWHAKDGEGQNNHVVQVDHGRTILFEDCAAFGIGRNTFHVFNYGKTADVTMRRCWGRWEGWNNEKAGPRITFQPSHSDAKRTLLENCISTWTGERWKDGSNTWGLGLVGSTSDSPTGHRAYGCIAYLKAGAKYTRGEGVFQEGACRNDHLKDVAVFIAPGVADRAMALFSSGSGSGNTADHLTLIAPQASTFDSGWTVTNKFDEPSVGAVPSVFGGAGADVSRRYVNGDKTPDLLFPWPMDDRIKAALHLAKSSELAGSAGPGYDEKTVTSEIVSMFGAIPGGAAPFDFSLSNPGPVTMESGTSTPVSIGVLLLDGPSQPVSFSVQNPPTGTTCAFSPTTLSPPGSVTLTLKASLNVAGTFTITVVGAQGTTERKTEFSLTVSSPPGTPDTTPPMVALAAPAPGTVAGFVTVTATASDNVGVSEVQFLLDGAPIGPEATVASIVWSTIVWSTTGVTNGPHVLSARARDAAGNTTTSASVAVTVATSSPPIPPADPLPQTPPRERHPESPILDQVGGAPGLRASG